MRGKLGQIIKTETRNRIIPAHAGQTHNGVLDAVCRSDHPRACGANFCVFVVVSVGAGSSPRMRGKQGLNQKNAYVTRIIPAHAGQTKRPDYKDAISTDHPRACGANQNVGRNRAREAGSSPRMRGKRGRWRWPVARPRIIPAHAGQTHGAPGKSTTTADHPRACGANG